MKKIKVTFKTAYNFTSSYLDRSENYFFALRTFVLILPRLSSFTWVTIILWHLRSFSDDRDKTDVECSVTAGDTGIKVRPVVRLMACLSRQTEWGVQYLPVERAVE